MSGGSAAHVGRLAILTYHSLDQSGSVVSVAPRRFADHVASLADAGLRGLTLCEAVQIRGRVGSWPANAVVLTFDDGFASVHAHALPLLSELGFAATVFVVSGHVGGHNDWAPPPAGLGQQAMLSWTQLGELLDAGWEVGGHTRTHPDLSRLDTVTARAEMLDGADDLSRRLGRPVTTFAYPYGKLNDAAGSIAASRFSAACTTQLARAAGHPLHELPRLDAYYLRGQANVVPWAAGRRDGYLALRRAGRRLRRAIGICG